MKEKDKELLVKDVSARVLYGVKVNIEKDYPNNPQVVERVAKDGEIIVDGIRAYDIYYYKPYLRPLSSMTEEEKDELYTYIDWVAKIDENCNLVADEYSKIYPDTCSDYIDWLNVHHFDYRGLIPIGLALEAPEDMYKTE